MARGGARAGAGRKAFCSETSPTGWRISVHAKKWILHQSKELGVSAGAIIDALIDHFESTIIKDE